MKDLLKKTDNYFLILPILFLWIVKLPHLDLPFFWDEAWSYFPAIHKMYESGPGIFPGDLPLWDAKGHPLFFFFISSVWMKVAGLNIFFLRLLPMFISTGVLLASWTLLKKHISLSAANIAILLISVQQLFLAQAAMFLPEMLVTLLLLISLHAYLSRNFWVFSITGTAMVMTKETSIVFIATFLINHLFYYLNPDRKSRPYIIESLLMAIPLLSYVVFLILHKKAFGSWFFDDHLGYISISGTEVLGKMKIALSSIFINWGRVLILISVLGAMAIAIYKKSKPILSSLASVSLLLMIVFISFSSFNFYTQRYMLSMIVLFMIVASSILAKARFGNRFINLTIVAILAVIPAFYTFTKKSNADSDLGYIEVVHLHQEMVEFMEDQGWKNEPVSASFNMIFALRNPILGYIQTDQGFANVRDIKSFRQSRIFVHESTFYDDRSQLDSIKSEKFLLKRFENKHAWGEIYIETEITP
ncbi:MAG TPA: hypothetical protein DCY35_08500 [Prolixibacteraceae bacterium]|nr:hypothetical protein [Prolixibacteraceae bacterium]